MTNYLQCLQLTRRSHHILGPQPSTSHCLDYHHLAVLTIYILLFWPLTSRCPNHQHPAVSTINDNLQLSLLSTTVPPVVSTISITDTTIPSLIQLFHHLYDHQTVTHNKINCYLLSYCYLAIVLFIVFLLSIYSPSTTNNLWGRCPYQPRNSFTKAKEFYYIPITVREEIDSRSSQGY